jgi:hypothetical protein
MDPAAVHTSDTARTAERFKIGLGGRQEFMPWPAGRYRQPSAVGSALTLAFALPRSPNEVIPGQRGHGLIERLPSVPTLDLADSAAVFRPGQCRHGQGEVIICRGAMPYRTSMNIVSPSWIMLKQPFTS